MNTGIGDAINLGWKLAHVVQRRADPSLLDTYEPERIGFARSLVATTDRAFTPMVAEGITGELARRIIAPLIFSVAVRFAPTRHAMFRLISQARIHYPDSPLSQGHAGHVHGGDRLPWVGPGEHDNFAPLRSLDWQRFRCENRAPNNRHVLWFSRKALFTGVSRHRAVLRRSQNQTSQWNRMNQCRGREQADGVYLPLARRICTTACALGCEAMAGAAEPSDPTKAPELAQRAWAYIRRSREQVTLRRGMNNSSGSTKGLLQVHWRFRLYPTFLRPGPEDCTNAFSCVVTVALLSAQVGLRIEVGYFAPLATFRFFPVVAVFGMLRSTMPTGYAIERRT
jgi:hypothetical protein